MKTLGKRKFSVMVSISFPVRFLLFTICVLLLSAGTGYGSKVQYDIVYIWDSNLDNVLDYKDQLEEVFDAEVQKRLRVVGKGDEYGVIYDTNGEPKDIIQELAKHGELLRNSGFEEAWAIEDEGYDLLYNVSYGLGPHLDALKKRYGKLYRYLGEEVGKNLFIEKTDANNYTLIYRHRGDRSSTMRIAQHHARILKAKKIKTSITVENNNEEVYGESSLLNDKDETAEEAASPTPVIAPQKSTVKHQEPLVEVTRAAGSSGVEENVENLIKRLRRAGKIRGDEKTSWMVYDLERNESLVDINANQLFQAASMIKPFVALAFFDRVQRGKLHYDQKNRRMMESMIQHSNNSATNWFIRQVGGPASCQQILTQNYGHIFKKIVISEYIPASGRTYKNSALPSDYIRYLRALWNNELPYGKEMRRVMALPGRARLHDGPPIPQGTLVYNKTGSTAHLIGDMGILVPKARNGKRHPYAIVGIIERSSRASDYGSWMLTRGNVIREVSTLVYQEMKKTYHLL